MMKTAYKLITGFILCTAIVAGCKPAHTPKNTVNAPSANDTASVKQTEHVAHYVRPEIPPVITTPQDRAEYYVVHYWDNYSWVDTAFVNSSETEQLYADFIDALKYVRPDEQAPALQAMMQHMQADSTAYAHFCFLSEKYLYDPNSPMRNEDFYIPVLKQMLTSPRLSAAEKLRPADRLKQARKNRPGMVATDFSYVTVKGEGNSEGNGSGSSNGSVNNGSSRGNGSSGSRLSAPRRMHQLQADYLLLFFYDPDCTNCRESEHILANIPFIVDLQRRGTLRILAVYPDDDHDLWLRKAPQMPQGWIVGWNQQGNIRSRQLYDIRATPTLYLLDKEKRVVLKDAPLEQVVKYPYSSSEFR